jgi:hypothetical protein
MCGGVAVTSTRSGCSWCSTAFKPSKARLVMSNRSWSSDMMSRSKSVWIAKISSTWSSMCRRHRDFDLKRSGLFQAQDHRSHLDGLRPGTEDDENFFQGIQVDQPICLTQPIPCTRVGAPPRTCRAQTGPRRQSGPSCL